MRVGIFVSTNPQESGGGYTYEHAVLESIVKLAPTTNHDFLIFSSDPHFRIENENFDKKIEYFRIPKNNLLIRLIEQFYLAFNSILVTKIYFRFLPLMNSIRRFNIDFIIFLHPKHGIVDIPSMTPVWDLQHRVQPWFPEVSENGEWEIRERYYQKVLPRSTFILTGTHRGMNEIHCFYRIPTDRIKITPLPTPLDVLQPTNKESDILQKNGIKGEFLLYPAQFWLHKNHVNCIRALDILHNQFQRKISLVFIGSDKGNLAIIQNAIIKHNLSDYVHTLGFVSRQDLISLYQNASAMLFPTLFGPDNIPPLEAFALGCPVIASDIPGAKEQLGDAAILINPLDPKSIADAIERLSSDEQFRQKIREKGLQRARSWTSDNYAREILSLLDEFERKIG